MIELDGVEYAAEDAATNAASMVTAINDYAAANDITNSKGELIQFEVNWANPFYMILYGVGTLFSYLQNLVYSAACSFNIAQSSERQLLNLADVANVRRKSATYTTIIGTVYADTAGTCSVTTTLSCTVSTSSGNITFHPAFDMEVLPGQAQKIVLITDVLGAFNIAANQVTSFDTNPTNFRAMQTSASVPGQDQETIQDLRRRIQRRVETGTMLDKAQDAISALPGISSCNIFYNTRNTSTTTIDGISVPPRQALLFIQGFSSDIAKTFFSYMMCQCAGSDSSDAIEQTYTTRSGQVFSVYIIPPTQTELYIEVYLKNDITDDVKSAIKDTICTLSQSLVIGQSLSAGEILQLIQTQYSSYTFLGCQLGLSASAINQYKVTPDSNQLLVFNTENIFIYGAS